MRMFPERREEETITVVVSEGEEVLCGQSAGELVVRPEMLGQAVNQNHQRPERKNEQHLIIIIIP